MRRTDSGWPTTASAARTRTITSELLNIPGVGPNRRRQLLERFGSLAGVESASVAELATVPGSRPGWRSAFSPT